eukprot:g15181.t1
MLPYPRGALLLVVACCATAPLSSEAAKLSGQHEDVADHQKSSAKDSGQLLSLLNGVFGDTNVVEHLASVQYDGVSDEPLLKHMKEVSKTLAEGPPQRTQVATPRFNFLLPTEAEVHANRKSNLLPTAKIEANPIWNLLRSLYMPEVVYNTPTSDDIRVLEEQHGRLFWNYGKGNNFKKEISMLLRNFDVSLKMADDPRKKILTETDFSSDAYSAFLLPGEDPYPRRKLVAASLDRLQATARFQSHALFRDGALGDKQIPSLLKGKGLTTDVKTFRVSPSPEKSKSSEWWDSVREMSKESRDKPLQLQVVLQPTVRDFETGRLLEGATKSFFDSRKSYEAFLEDEEKNEGDHDDDMKKKTAQLAKWWQTRSLRLVFFFKGGKLVKWQMEAGVGKVDRLIVEPKAPLPAASSEDPSAGAIPGKQEQRQEQEQVQAASFNKATKNESNKKVVDDVEEMLCKEFGEKLCVTAGRVGPSKTDAAEAGDAPAPADATGEPTPYNNNEGLFDFDKLDPM